MTNPAMLTEEEHSLLLVAVIDRIVMYTETRNDRAANTLRSALRKVENELVPTDTKELRLAEDDSGQLTVEWPERR